MTLLPRFKCLDFASPDMHPSTTEYHRYAVRNSVVVNRNIFATGAAVGISLTMFMVGQHWVALLYGVAAVFAAFDCWKTVKELGEVSRPLMTDHDEKCVTKWQEAHSFCLEQANRTIGILLFPVVLIMVIRNFTRSSD